MIVRMVDIDGKMPIIPLMKVSAFHKSKGDDVDWHNPMMDQVEKPDLIYASKLFDFSDDYMYFPKCQIIKGGTGYDLTSHLPDEIEQIHQVDYSIYPQHKYTIQFFSRGCIRRCPFCVVYKKEGYIYAVDPLSLNPKGNWIEVLDNNFFANPEWRKSVDQLLKWKQPINLHGVDVRIMTDEQAYALNQLKHTKQIHIAWDNPKDNLMPNIKTMLQYIKAWKIMCYVLIGYWSSPEEDMYRVMELESLGIDPFVMPFNKEDTYQNRFARWVNHKGIFKTTKWEDYK